MDKNYNDLYIHVLLISGVAHRLLFFMGVKVFHPKNFFLSLLHIFCGVFLVEIYLTVLCKLLTAYILPNIYIIYQVNVVAFFVCPSRSRSIHG